MGYINFSDVEQFRTNEVFNECLDLKFTQTQETLSLYLKKKQLLTTLSIIAI
jgi:hypothetical protein